MNLPIQLNFLLDFLPWLSEHGFRVVFIIITAFICDALIRNSLAKKGFGTSIGGFKQRMTAVQKQRMKTILNVTSGILSFVIFVIAVMMIMPEFGINIAPILAGLGLAGLAVGMAAKDIITDFLTGFFILAESQYNIGDRVKISGIEGIVKEISLRRTMIEADDGTYNYIPNREIKIVTRAKNEHETEFSNDYY